MDDFCKNDVNRNVADDLQRDTYIMDNLTWVLLMSGCQHCSDQLVLCNSFDVWLLMGTVSKTDVLTIQTIQGSQTIRVIYCYC